MISANLRSLMLLMLVACGGADAADIRMAVSARGEPLGAIMIEGEIVEGDYAKFANVFIDNFGRNYSVALYSPGGDFVESLKIGRLIHALKLSTEAPNSDMFPLYTINSPSNRLCASSCFFLFAAGASRYGDIVGIHRPYPSRSAYRNLDLDHASEANAAIRAMVES